MLKRKLISTLLFNTGLLVLLTVSGAFNKQPAVNDTTVKETVDPFIRQLQAFDSSFVFLAELPDSLYDEIPRVPLSSNVSKFMDSYIAKNSERLAKIGENGQKHFDMMDSVFEAYNLPYELKYLAVVESELKAKAVSRVGAVGPWQLMAPTARILSLKVTRKNDERTHYYKSTVAAAKYLRDLYAEYGDWLLVIAAYNCGPGNVNKAIRYAGSKSFWKIQNFLPAETRGHVKKFIATHYFYEEAGSITTLTKAEVAKYKKQLTEFMNKQKQELEREQSIVAKNNNNNTETESK